MNTRIAPSTVRRPGMILLLALVALLASSAPRATASPTAQTLYVAPGGANNTACGPVTSPCLHIQYAVNKAVSGDTILVAAATYAYESRFDQCSFLETRSVVCVVNKTLTIKGGYAPGSWSSQDVIRNRTIIEGGAARRGVAVVAFQGTAYLTMSGFTIQNGRSQGTDARGNNEFFRQGTGAGVWGQGGGVNLRDMIIQNNIATGVASTLPAGGGGAGGGVAITATPDNMVSQLTNVTFIGNEARGNTGATRGGVGIGGGLFTDHARMVGNNLIFRNNLAVAGNSAGTGTVNIQADGLGGAAAFETGSNTTISGFYAQDNRAVGGQAGAGNNSDGGNGFGGALFLENAPLLITDVRMFQNESVGGNAFNAGGGFGGGFHVQNGDIVMERAQIIANRTLSGTSSGGTARATAGGGGYINMEQNYSPVRTATLANVIFADNRIDIGQGTTRYAFGGGLIVQGQQATINHATFARNVLGAGAIFAAGLMVTGTAGGTGTPGRATISDSIFAEHVNGVNAPALQVSGGSSVTLSRGLFAGNTKNTNGDNAPEPAGTISGFSTMTLAPSPAFASPGAPNFNYRLSASSPAIDLATGSTTALDVDIQPRPSGAARDLGADEYYLLDQKTYVPALSK